jgi:hypothetical protein
LAAAVAGGLSIIPALAVGAVAGVAFSAVRHFTRA